MQINTKETYRPLPIGLTIKKSKIEGLGLHAEQSIEAGTVLGETHVLVHSRDRHEWIRTPLGGFINHSEDTPSVVSYASESEFDFDNNSLSLAPSVSPSW